MNYYKNFLESIKEKKFRISQIDQAIYKNLVSSFDEITTLPKDLMEKLNTLEFFPIKKVVEKISPKDGTVKVLFESKDSLKFESVLMRHYNERNTVCVSCQVGCAQNCSFCATGKLGLKRNLSADEIIAQILYFQRKINKEEGEKITNVVFMGMGEPFHNYENVIESINILHDQKKFGLGARHITVSTSGVIKKIYEISDFPLQINLAISIHAGTNETRTKIMPINKFMPIEDLIKAIDFYYEKTKRKIFYEYVMIKGVNDDINEAFELSKKVKHQICHINMIPFNSGGNEEFRKSSDEKIFEFQKVFDSFGIPSTKRFTLGDDIDGACGQLSNKT